MDLYLQRDKLIQQLQYSVKELAKNGQSLAEAEMNYKIAVNKKALQLKDDGMAVTLIQTIIYGYDDIARLRFKRDCAEAIYNANQESINSIKLQLRLIENQTQREYAKEIVE